MPDQLYGSRTAWLNHEDTFHRQAWRCRDHQDAMFITEGAFVAHLGSLHSDLTADDVQALLDMSLTVREDTREYCPLCFIPVVRLARGQNLLKHIANHMERLACFALPRDVGLHGDLEENESLNNRVSVSDRSDGSQLLSDYNTASEQSEVDAPSLYRESWDDSADTVRALLEAGADVNAQGGKYGNALQAASYKGHMEIVDTLLAHGANVNAQGGHFGNALQAASYKGHTDIVKALLEWGANVNAQGGRFGQALQSASHEDHESVVNLLLNHGANVDARGGEFGTALQAACLQGHEPIVRVLLAGGADVSFQSGELGSALQVASFEGHEALVRLLLAGGAAVNAQSGIFSTALQAAAQQGHTAIVQLLVDHGANVNITGGKIGCALNAACLQNNEAIIRLLLEQGADVNMKAGEYGTALQAASVHGDETVVRLLLDRGANVNMQGDENKSALQIASAAGHETVVRMLLDSGAVDIDSEGVHGGAHRAAVDAGYNDIAQLLQPGQPLITADRLIVLEMLPVKRPLWLLKTMDMTLVKSPADTPYAILSHTWGQDEPQFHDVGLGKETKNTSSKGWSKIVGACKQASRDGLQYIWADTCCIDKRSAVELDEAINMSFDYYRGAAVCYVYMADVAMKTSKGVNTTSPFSESRWHTRGWTLQELLAPRSVHFYDCDWTFIGTLSQLTDIVVRATGIPGPVLRHETALQDCSVAQRLSWAANRQTSRIEDLSYAMIGIFDVRMSLLYGEGDHAFQRLQKELLISGDMSVLAWAQSGGRQPSSLLATSPADFRGCGNVVSVKSDHDMMMTSGGLKGTFEVVKSRNPFKNSDYYVSLHSYIRSDEDKVGADTAGQEIWLVARSVPGAGKGEMVLQVGGRTQDAQSGTHQRIALGPQAGKRSKVAATFRLGEHGSAKRDLISSP
ncbi:hypothetical protein LTR10_008528 [Elasticomyces elasticus]|nr:hypothetical protein LTR10_008528 [Elasticomyces elasticus]